MRAVLHHPAVVHDHDPVGTGRRGEAVGDDQGGAAAGEAVRGLVDLGLRGEVERGGRLVEEQHVGVDQLGAGQRDELALAGGQVAAALGDLVQVAALQRRDHLVRADRPRRRLHLRVGGLGAAVGDGVPDGPGEEVGLLRDDAEPVPVGGEVECAYVGAVGQDPAAGRVVEPGDQLDQGGLARAGLADERDGLSGGDGQGDAGEGLLLVAVGEVDVLEGDLAAQPAHLGGGGGVLRGGGLLEQFLDAAEETVACW